MIKLAAEERLAVAIGANHFRPLAERVHNPEMHRARIRSRIDIAPIHLAGLKLHEPLRSVDAALEIVDEAHLRAVAQPEPERAGLQVSVHRVKRPGDDIQILSGQRRIDDVMGVHEVGCDPLLLGVFAEQSGLETNVIGGFLREPALKIQERVGVHLRHYLVLVGNANLIVILVQLRPEGIAPVAVEIIDGAIFLSQPGTEFQLAVVAITIVLAVMAQLIVDLPAPDGRIVAEALPQLRDNF